MKYIKRILEKTVRLKDIIVFESYPDFSDNTYPVYLYIKQNYPQYKLIWMLSGKGKMPEGLDGYYYYNGKGFYNLIKKYYYRIFAKASVSCNGGPITFFPSKQFSLYLCHGSKTKNTKGLYSLGAIDCINLQSHFFDQVAAEGYNCRKDQFVYLGYPRCDYFFLPQQSEMVKSNLKLLNVEGDYIMWLPTFRKIKNHERDAHSNSYDSIGIPLIYSEDCLLEFNQFLNDNNIHIIFKPHFAQDLATLTRLNLTNFHIITNDILDELNLQLYQVIAYSKALISDYSSVFYDYLLLNRPIAMTIDDIENWKQARGFAFDIEELYNRSAERLSTVTQLRTFIANTLNGIDKKYEERQKIRNLTNMHLDGRSAERVADFIIKKIREKAG